MTGELDPRWRVKWDVEMPRHMSVTLATKVDNCPRDGGMYLKYRGQASASQLLRGSFGHLVFERIMGTLIQQGEQSLVAAHPGEDPMKAAAEVSQMTKEWVDEIALEVGWPLSEYEIDQCRQMAYHFAIGNPVDPSTVVALEQAFLLDLGEGRTLLGKVDLASLRPDGILWVRDFKTSLYVPPGDAVSEMIQVPLYAALLLFGRPYERADCEACDGDGAFVALTGSGRGQDTMPCSRCEGLGYVEVIGESLGLQDYVSHVWCEQVYPRFLNDAGEMSSRTVQAPNGGDLWTVPDLRDKGAAASRLWSRVQLGVAESYWPAKSGDKHCNLCTARAQCPIPAALRRFAGEVSTVQQASEALEWALQQAKLTSATRDEVKAFMKGPDAPEDGRLPVGADEYGFVVSNGTKVKQKGRSTDWDGLREAIDGAANEGAPFAVEDWLTPTVKTDFKRLPKREDAGDG